MDQDNTLPEPRREFYLSNPRSALLREHCVGMIHDFDTLLAGDNPVDEVAAAYADLYNHKAALTELGVETKMHTTKPPKPPTFFIKDPVNASEYIAGQLLDLLEKPIFTESESMPVIQEFTESNIDNARFIDPASIPEKTRLFLTSRTLVQGLKGWLGYTEEDELKPTED
jgi:hypothetical protein